MEISRLLFSYENKQPWKTNCKSKLSHLLKKEIYNIFQHSATPSAFIGYQQKADGMVITPEVATVPALPIGGAT